MGYLPQDKMPRILFISMPGVTHASQWVGQLESTSWDVHFFPSHDGTPYLDTFKNMTVYSKSKFSPSEKTIRVNSLLPVSSYRVARWAQKLFPKHFDSARWLATVIDRLQPDLIHSMEMQRGAYLVDEARKYLNRPLPPWIVTPWGSDLYLYKNLSAHIDKLRSVLGNCQYFWAECQRDFQYAAELGFKGKMLEAVPASGGYDSRAFPTTEQIAPSKRKYIMVKGYQGFAGRALNAFSAMRLCREEMKGYKVVLYLSCYDVDLAAELFTKDTGIEVQTLRFPRPYEEIQSFFAKSRVHIGLSISDGLPTTVIESMARGTFPIQSDSSCAHEWIKDGKNGLLVPADDPNAIAEALRRALKDDRMVDESVKINADILADKLEYQSIREKVLKIYDSLL